MKRFLTSKDQQALPGQETVLIGWTPRVSVALAVQNDKDSIIDQVPAILRHLGPDDELVISDDGSMDGTADLLASLIFKDRRIRWIDGPRRGPVLNLTNALRYCQGEIVFISEPGDVWLDEKISRVLAAFARQPDAMMVQHDVRYTDRNRFAESGTLFDLHKARPGMIRNIFKNPYRLGAIAIRKKFLRIALPIPPEIASSAQWIGLLAEQVGQAVFLDGVLMLTRKDDQGLAKKPLDSLRSWVASRAALVRALRERVKKAKSET